LEKVVDLVTLSTKKIGFAIFGFFYELILNLQVTGSNHKTGKNILALGPLELLKLSQLGPCPPLGPDGGGVLAGGEVGHGEVNKRHGSAIGLTRDRLVEEDRPGRSPASGGGGAEAARSRRLGRR
jgi:hypothetical protein